jgi:fructoselysine-6-P-deglycase FrlB-like protein
MPLSEQLTAPLSFADRVVIVTSQSGESAEVVRWLAQVGQRDGVYGMTLDPRSTLARAVPCLIGEGGVEVAFAATRSLTVTLALHLAILAGLGEDPDPALAALQSAARQDTGDAVKAFAAVRVVVTSGRRLQGLAEAMSLGVSELARIPAFALEGGQFRHGPPEMLGPEVGVVLLRGDEAGADLIAHTAVLALESGSPVVVFDASGSEPTVGAVNVRWPRAAGLAAPLAILPTAQRFVLEFAAGRVADVGTPLRSSKVTARE